MRILIHEAHSGFQYEFAKTGHEFFSMQGAWEDYRRPKPANWHLIESLDDRFDLGVILAGGVFEKLSPLSIPLIVYVLGDNGEGEIPAHVEERVSKFVFLSKEVSERWVLLDGRKKMVIELGVDPEVFNGYVGNGGNVLTVGWSIPTRWEKGLTQLNAVNAEVPLTLIGKDNESLGYAVGTVPFETLLQAYRSYKVYFNPGSIIGMSVIEAMMAGMPIVTFRPINLTDLIVHGKNGFVVDTVHGAVARIHDLLKDSELRVRMAQESRKTAIERFGITQFVSRWNNVFEEVAKNCK